MWKRLSKLIGRLLRGMGRRVRRTTRDDTPDRAEPPIYPLF